MPEFNVGQALNGIVRTVGDIAKQGAGAAANAISFKSQAAQGAFNQASANNANYIGDYRLADQYGFNSAQAMSANDFTEMMWNRAAAWNEQMMEKQMKFNAEQAELNRAFQKEMDSTKYARAVADMEKAGLNPIMAVTGGGISAGGGTGATASVGAPQMSSAQGAMASGGLINGISASEGNFSGQMDYLSGILGLMGGVVSSIASAYKGLELLGNDSIGSGLAKTVGEALDKYVFKPSDKNELGRQWITGRANQKDPDYKPNWRNGIDWNLKNYVLK